MATEALRVSDISAASPEMSDDDFRALTEDIRQHGQLVPIWKSGAEIIDGRKRLRVCEVLGIEPVVVDVTPGQDAEALSYSLNILRTHYSVSQRAMVAAKRANLGDGQRKSQQVKFNQLANSPKDKTSFTTIAEAAREAGVNRSAVVAAKLVRREAAPEVSAAVEAGKLTLHSAKQIAAAVPNNDQPAAVEKVIKASAGKARHTPARVLGKQVERKSVVRPLAQRMERGLDQLEGAIELLAKFFEEEGGSRVAWTKRLCAARTQLTRIITLARRNA